MNETSFFGSKSLPTICSGCSVLLGDERALVHGRQERAVPQRRPDGRRHVGTEHDVAGQVLVLGTEPVGEPRPERWTADLDVAGVHHQHRRLVVRDVGVHRANHADVVGAGADVREELADLEAALAVARELERRLHQRAGPALGGHGAAGKRLAVILRQHRLGIEAVHLRQPAVHEQEDDVLGARRMMQSAGRGRGLRPLARAPLPTAIAKPGRQTPSCRSRCPCGRALHGESRAGAIRCDISVHEQELVRAEEHLDVAAERGHRQHLLLVVFRRSSRPARRPPSSRLLEAPAAQWVPPSPARLHQPSPSAWRRWSSLPPCDPRTASAPRPAGTRVRPSLHPPSARGRTTADRPSRSAPIVRFVGDASRRRARHAAG